MTFRGTPTRMNEDWFVSCRSEMASACEDFSVVL
jgi:hypothetical protein